MKGCHNRDDMKNPVFHTVNILTYFDFEHRFPSS